MPQAQDVFRAAAPLAQASQDLGLLEDLPGLWLGNGFNMIARPKREGGSGGPEFFLEVNATQETLQFTAIGGAIPDRGSSEPTALLHGMHYLQTVADCVTHEFIHKEPGLWVHVPETAENEDDTYVRMAVIPHGDSLLAQSTFTTRVAGGPDIKPVDSLPFSATEKIPGLNETTQKPVGLPGYTDPYLNGELPGQCLPPGLEGGATIKDPTEVLRKQIDGQQIDDTAVIAISTVGVQSGGIVNIPFVVKNANAVQLDAIFWIEKVTRPDYDRRPSEFLQLQYVQRVILDFEEIHWPHISVATLVKTG